MIEQAPAVISEDLTQKTPVPKPAEPQAVEPQVDAPAEPEKPEEEPLSTKFAALARKEKALMEKERELKKLQESVKLTELTREQIKKDPDSAIKAAGFKDLEEFITVYLQSTSKTPPSLEDKVKELEEKLTLKEQKELEAMREREEREAREAEEQAISAFKGNIKDFVDSDPDKYELIAANDAYDVIYDTVYELYQQYEEAGQTQSFNAQEAMQKIADELEAELLAKLEGFKKLKKFGYKEPEIKAPPAKETFATTLTNRQTPNSSAPVQQTRRLTREESIALAAQKLKFK